MATGMRTEVVRSLADVSHEAWNGIAREAGLYSSHEWLTVVERETVGTVRYVLVRDSGGELIAGLPVYLLDTEADEYYRPSLHFPELDRETEGQPILLLGSRSGYRNHLLLAAALTERERTASVDLIAVEVRELATAAGCRYGFFFFVTNAGMQVLEPAAALRCRPILHWVAESMLRCTGGGFADYLESLGHRRRKAFREIDRFQAAGLVLEQADPWQMLPATSSMIHGLKRKYQVPISREAIERRLTHQFEVLGDRARLLVCRDGKRTIGAVLAYNWDGWLYVTQGGFDYPNLKNAFEYFNLAFFEPLRHAYDNGLEGVHLGAASHEAKLMHGARVKPLHTFVMPIPQDVGDPVHDGYRQKMRNHWAEQRSRFPRAFDELEWGM